MKNTGITIILLFISLLIFPKDITGSWTGSIDLGTQKLRIVFHITKGEQNYSAMMDSPDQNVKGIPVNKITFENASLLIEMPELAFTYKGTFNGEDDIEGDMKQGPMSLTLNLKRTSNEPQIVNKLQEPKKPYPYLSEDIKFENKKESFFLAGTLTIPSQTGEFPAVILVSGSGSQDRDESILGHKPFLVLSDYLTRKGIAVLRYDDRGYGKSGGDAHNATTLDIATDAEAAIEYLKTRKEIDSKKIGIIGHSEGGTIAFILASKNKDISYIISLAGGSIKGDSILYLQNKALYSKVNAPNEKILDKIEELNSLFSIIRKTTDTEVIKQEVSNLYKSQGEQTVDIAIKQATSPWLRFFIDMDPQEYLKKIKCPVFALNGTNDLQVTPKENLAAIKYNVEQNGNKSVTIKEYLNLNHLFQTSSTGLPNEYGQIEETISPQVLEDITNWILGIVN